MKLQERLRRLSETNEFPEGKEAADALDAQEARIKALEELMTVAGQRDWAIKQNAANYDRATKAEAERDAARKENAALREAFVYKSCWQYADDCPGVRADCGEKIAKGKPCKECPKSWTPEAIAAREGK